MLHPNNNNAKAARGQPVYDPLFKIRPIIDTLVTKFQDVYTPEEQLTIDEAICPFRGHIFFRVYIKGKPHKYGIRMFELYTGAHPTKSELNTAFSVVDRLCDKIKGKGHCVHGQMVLQPKDFRPFMELQDKGCRHSDVQQKRNA